MWWNIESVKTLENLFEGVSSMPERYIPAEGTRRHRPEEAPATESASEQLTQDIQALLHEVEGIVPSAVAKALYRLSPSAPPLQSFVDDILALEASLRTAAAHLNGLAKVLSRLPQTPDGLASTRRRALPQEKMGWRGPKAKRFAGDDLTKFFEEDQNRIHELVTLDAGSFETPWTEEMIQSLLHMPGWESSLVVLRDRKNRILAYALTVTVTSDAQASSNTVAILRVAGQSTTAIQALLKKLPGLHQGPVTAFVAIEEYESREIIERYLNAGFVIDQDKSRNTDHIHLKK